MNSEKIKKNVRKNVELTYKIRNLLLSGRLRDFGIALNETWQLKKTFSNMISNNYLDEIYRGAINNGALGGKILGAGGGGFFLFYVPPFEKVRLLAYLKERDLGVCDIFDLKNMAFKLGLHVSETNKKMDIEFT